ncbi:MAG: efflux RND transporter permease subunit [Gammaproteobacteria bacterium]|nr:MAG: efflux RND transporter permease subunit [Gammaproteobacteria bacterium]
MIAWFARNGVAANLLMLVIVFVGLYAVLTRIPLEVFPAFELDIITVRVPFRGATPADVEEGVVTRVEEAIYDLEGIKQLRSRASEGFASITVELDSGFEPRDLLDDIKNRVDAISTFPGEVERPVYSIAKRIHEVISVVVSGDLGERELRRYGERVRDDISAIPGITQVELRAVRPYEIAIEIPENTLHRHGLTIDAVAEAIRRASLDLSAGSIKTSGGEILLRTKEQAYIAADFASIVVLSRADGTRLTLGDIADIRDGFEENPVRARFNKKPAVVIEVNRIGGQNAIDVADKVKRYIEDAQGRFPASVTLSYWRDRSQVVKSRLGTLTRSALQGGLLIFLLLALFLRFSVALWVCVGIPVAFMGALALMPTLGVSINVISLFAFILVLGVVVDDAIVTGENIYTHVKRGEAPGEAVVRGTQEVALPVTFGILTTVAAFVPLLMIEGARGQMFAQIPLIVIPALLFSLVESKLILPAHLRHLDLGRPDPPLVRLQQKVADGLERAIVRLYQPVLALALRYRYLALSLFVGTAVVVGGIVASGQINFIFFPRIQSETARATLTMPAGTPFEVTAGYIDRIARAAQEIRDKYVDAETGKSVVKDILSTQGSTGGSGAGASNLGRVTFEIESPEKRTLEVTSSQLVREWRRAIGIIPGTESLTFRAELGHGGGSPVEVRLAGSDIEQLAALAGEIKTRLRQYSGVFDVGDSFEAGKQELQLAIKPEAELLDLSATALARQVRQAFFGEQAQRIQRGRDDVRVMVRYPESERRSLQNLESMRIRSPSGIEVPFSEVADATMGRGYAVIKRVDRRRVVTVSADVNKETTNIESIKRDLLAFLASIEPRFPDVRYSLEGEAREQRESFGSLRLGLAFVLFIIYALLAIPFKSYGQPLIVMSVLPFGVVGAILGHMLLGLNLSIFSLMGMLALIGVVVNDSLILVDYVNRRRAEGRPTIEAVRIAGVARFRAVMLTSLTTFAGLAPLIFEKSTQAQFLIPMAVSLGFGILFATFITLFLVPVNYMILEDLVKPFRKNRSATAEEQPAKAQGALSTE